MSDVAVAEVVRQVLRELNMVIDEPLDKSGAARHLKISVKTMEKRLRNGSLPSRLIHRNEGSIYFFPSELNEFIKAS